LPTPLHRECRQAIADLRALADALEAELRRITPARKADPSDRQDRTTR
jgi:hypothetical protein